MEYLNFRGGLPWLSLMIFLPLVGAVLAAITPDNDNGRLQKLGTFALSLAPLGIALAITAAYYGQIRAGNGVLPNEPQQQIYDFAERTPWITTLGIDYTLGVDGISLPLILLTTLLVPLAIVASWNMNDRPRWFFPLILLMETTILGVFMSLNFFLWFIFWELSLVPVFYLISGWGRDP